MQKSSACNSGGNAILQQLIPNPVCHAYEEDHCSALIVRLNSLPLPVSTKRHNHRCEWEKHFLCQGKFTWASSLQHHVQIHTVENIRPLSCELCEALSSKLQQHVRIHTGERPLLGSNVKQSSISVAMTPCANPMGKPFSSDIVVHIWAYGRPCIMAT